MENFVFLLPFILSWQLSLIQIANTEINVVVDKKSNAQFFEEHPITDEEIKSFKLTTNDLNFQPEIEFCFAKKNCPWFEEQQKQETTTSVTVEIGEELISKWKKPIVIYEFYNPTAEHKNCSFLLSGNVTDKVTLSWEKNPDWIQDGKISLTITGVVDDQVNHALNSKDKVRKAKIKTLGAKDGDFTTASVEPKTSFSVAIEADCVIKKFKIVYTKKVHGSLYHYFNEEKIKGVMDYATFDFLTVYDLPTSLNATQILEVETCYNERVFKLTEYIN